MQIALVAFVGLCLSAYALKVYFQKEKPICDIRENVSCTRAFSSQYGKTLGIHNAFFGAAFYLALIILDTADITILPLTAAALLGTAFLAYISYFKMRNFCVVCTAVYLVNVALFLLALSGQR